MARLSLILVTLAIVVTCITSAFPISKENDQQRAKSILVKDNNGDAIDVYENSFLDEEHDGKILQYEPFANRRIEYQTNQGRYRMKAPLNLEREDSDLERRTSKDTLSSVAASSPSASESLSDSDRFGSIAFNSREVRLVGPNQKEVEMKDDMASKMVVVLENLQKEASQVFGQVNDKLDKSWKDIKRSEVWGQVNDRLDKGWTDLKSMIGDVVAPASKRQQP